MVFFVGHSIAVNLSQLSVSPWLMYLSPKTDRKFNQQVEHWFSLVLLTSTRLWAPTKLVLTGDRDLLLQSSNHPSTLTGNSSYQDSGVGSTNWFAPAVTNGCMIISNHQTYFDWIIIWILSYMERCDSFMKIILKHELKKVPVFGWGMRLFDFIFLKRKWADDQQTFASHMRRIVEHDDPAWLLIFPEGTVVCEKRTVISNKYADKMGLRRPEHTLLPRVNGSRVCLSKLRSRIPYLYDLTIGYEGLKSGDIPEDEYGLISMYGKGVYPREVHIHVKRYAVADIPDDEEGFSKWMYQVYVEKDKRMAKFYELGRFPHTHEEDQNIPSNKPVLQATRQAQEPNFPIEYLFVCGQVAGTIYIGFSIYRYLWSGAMSVLSYVI